MENVDVYLLNHDVGQVHLLSIPKQDVYRLSLKPVKWLRFIMFAICGVHGTLSATPRGPPADNNFADRFYYDIHDAPRFIDIHGLNEKITTSKRTPRSSDFRKEILDRDQACVVTHSDSSVCDAAHILPRCRSDNYIKHVVQTRRDIYSLPNIEINEIDDKRNGILLNKTCHTRLSKGTIAFMKTPNFALERNDIPSGSFTHKDLAYRVTMQVLVDDGDIFFPLVGDARLIGPEDSLPPPLLLDFHYGMAVYKRWRCEQSEGLLREYHNNSYRAAQDQQSPAHFSAQESTDDSTSDQTRTSGSERSGEGIAKAIDDLNRLFMLLSGTTPENEAEKFEKRIQEEKLKEEEASRMKVMEWMGSVANTSSVESDVEIEIT